MKNITLFLAFACAFSMLTAQGWNESTKVGIKAGLGFSVQSNDQENSSNYAALTPSVGLFAHFPIPSFSDGNLGVNIEGLFTAKGGKYTSYDYGDRTDWQNTMGYLQVPILLQYTFGENIKLFFNAGFAPGVAVLKRGKYTYTYRDSWGDIHTSEYVYPQTSFSTFDFSFLCGGGARFHLGSRELALELRMDYGLIPVGDFSIAGSSRIVKAWNRTWLIMLSCPLN